MIPLIIQDQVYTIQNLQRSPIPQTSNWSGTFFAVSYSKPALGFLSLLLKHLSGFFGGLLTYIVSDLEHLDIRTIFQEPGIKLESFEGK